MGPLTQIYLSCCVFFQIFTYLQVTHVYLYFIKLLKNYSMLILGRSLMTGWRKNSWNPERVPSVVTFVSVPLSVCISVCTRATGHSFLPRNLIFGLSDPWDTRKKRIFLFFEIFIFTLFIGIFRFFSLYNTSKFLVSGYRSLFFT